MKLTKDEIAARKAITERLAEARNQFTDAWADLETKLEDYNGALADLDQWRIDVVDRIQDEISDHSEKWQESDKGQKATDWVGEYESLDLDQLALEMPDLSHQDELEALAEEC